MAEFIFMLTREDRTVENALEVYEEVRGSGLRYVGFKDVGLSFDRLKDLAAAIREGGQKVMLEVVSEEKEDELRSAHAALDLGVDYLLGGTYAEEVTKILSETEIVYCPFPGRVVGHPSMLRGSVEEIVESSRRLSAMDEVRGLDLLAYRYAGNVDALVRAVIGAVNVPVIAAGSVDSEEKVRRLTEAGVWGFTVGSAIFDGEFLDGEASISKRVEHVLELTSSLTT